MQIIDTQRLTYTGGGKITSNIVVDYGIGLLSRAGRQAFFVE